MNCRVCGKKRDCAFRCKTCRALICSEECQRKHAVCIPKTSGIAKLVGLLLLAGVGYGIYSVARDTAAPATTSAAEPTSTAGIARMPQRTAPLPVVDPVPTAPVADDPPIIIRRDEATTKPATPTGPTPETRERYAASKLKQARQLQDMGKLKEYRESLEELTKEHKGTKAAEEAAALLKKR